MKESIRPLLNDVEQTLIDLSKINSVTPPSDTKEIVDYVARKLVGLPGVEVSLHTEEEPIISLVAKVNGHKVGKTLLLNGHLDTFEVVAENEWNHNPFGGEVENRRLFGVGVSDMKAGCASLLETFIYLAKHPELWKGTVILTLVGGEESGGKHGTEFLLRSMPELSKADACLIGDVGSARVVRFGEKGRCRFKLTARGVPGHGAHVHKTKNAVDMLIKAIVEYNEAVASIKPKCPKELEQVIREAGKISEEISGKGETETLLSVSTNIGTFHGGTAPNLVPGYAEALIDSRLPIGVAPEQIIEILKEIKSNNPGVDYEIKMTCESLYSDPNHDLLIKLVANAEKSFGQPCTATVRVGGTDAKHIRRYGVPAYSCGVEGGKMGAPDEFVDLDELDHLFEIHLTSVLEYMS